MQASRSVANWLSCEYLKHLDEFLKKGYIMDYVFFSSLSSSLTSHVPLTRRRRLVSWIACSPPADRQPTALRKCKEMDEPEVKYYAQLRLPEYLVEGGGVTKSANLHEAPDNPYAMSRRNHMQYSTLGDQLTPCASRDITSWHGSLGQPRTNIGRSLWFLLQTYRMLLILLALLLHASSRTARR